MCIRPEPTQSQAFTEKHQGDPDEGVGEYVLLRVFCKLPYLQIAFEWRKPHMNGLNHDRFYSDQSSVGLR